MLSKLLFKILLLSTLFFNYSSLAQKSDTSLIFNHLNKITKTNGFRNFSDTNVLNEVADYVFTNLSKYADTTFYQNYYLEGVRYKNVIARINSKKGLPVIVLGAHYDVCGFQEGADDNASGVVGLLESARLLSNQKLNYCIELVAYTLEEPPFFRTEYMGSHIHAQSLIDSNVDVYGMVSLEMIAYFTDVDKTQDYPLNFLKLIYGNKGDYITLVNCFRKGKFAKNFSKQFANNNLINSKRFTGPKYLQGIDFSDHMNYWKHSFSALMLTDTAFYRNKNYHQKSDTLETLDIFRMSKVIDTLVQTLKDLK